MKLGEHLESDSGSAPDRSRTLFSGLDVAVKGYEPILKGIGRWNLELFALMTRRSRAWLGVPTRLGQCRSPQELAYEQLRFWQTAASDYTEAAQRMVAAFGAAMPELSSIAQRDYITVEQPSTPAAKRNDRKAA